MHAPATPSHRATTAPAEVVVRRCLLRHYPWPGGDA